MTRQPSRTESMHSPAKLPPTLNLHIQDLVLHGFGPVDHNRIGEAMEHELARLFGAQGFPGSLVRSMALDSLDAGVLKIGSGATPEPIGIQLAQAIHGTLTRNLPTDVQTPQGSPSTKAMFGIETPKGRTPLQLQGASL